MSSPKSRLTDQEKKNNHIASEQKRRQAIREGFDRLATIVPGMEGQGRSEAIVLDATVQYMTNALQQRQLMLAKAKEMGIDTKEFEISGLEKPFDPDELWVRRFERDSRLNAARLRRSHNAAALDQSVAPNGGQKDTRYDIHTKSLDVGGKSAQTDAQHAALSISEGDSCMITPHDIDATEVVARKNTFHVAGDVVHNAASNNTLNIAWEVAQTVAQDATIRGARRVTLEVDEDTTQAAAKDPGTPQMESFALGAPLEARQDTQKGQNGADLNNVHGPQHSHTDSNLRDAQVRQHSHDSLGSLFGTPKSRRRGGSRRDQYEQNGQNERKAQNDRMIQSTQHAQIAQNSKDDQDDQAPQHIQNGQNLQTISRTQEYLEALEPPLPGNSRSRLHTQYDESGLYAPAAQDHQVTGNARNAQYTQSGRSGLSKHDTQDTQDARHRQAPQYGQNGHDHSQYRLLNSQYEQIYVQHGQNDSQYGPNRGQSVQSYSRYGQNSQNQSQYGHYAQSAYDSPISGHGLYVPNELHDEHHQHGNHGHNSRYNRNGH